MDDVNVCWWIFGFSMKFDEDDEEKERKEEDEVFYKFLGLVPLQKKFFILVPLTLWLNIWNDTSVLYVTSHVATSSSVCHINVFVTDDDGRDQNQNVYNLRG